MRGDYTQSRSRLRAGRFSVSGPYVAIAVNARTRSAKNVPCLRQPNSRDSPTRPHAGGCRASWAGRSWYSLEPHPSMRRLVVLLVATLLTTVPGCAHTGLSQLPGFDQLFPSTTVPGHGHHAGLWPGLHSGGLHAGGVHGTPGGGPVAPLVANPLFIPVTDRDFLWDQLIDTVDDHFRIQREERVKLVGDILTEGAFETVPAVAATYLEPWRTDSPHGYERLHATLQSIRRRATARVTPTEGGYLVDLAVFKELEDVDRPEQSSAGGAVIRHDGSLIRQKDRLYGGPVTLGWIPMGRDAAFEQRLLGDLQARVANIDPTRAP